MLIPWSSTDTKWNRTQFSSPIQIHRTSIKDGILETILSNTFLLLKLKQRCTAAWFTYPNSGNSPNVCQCVNVYNLGYVHMAEHYSAIKINIYLQHKCILKACQVKKARLQRLHIKWFYFYKPSRRGKSTKRQ